MRRGVHPVIAVVATAVTLLTACGTTEEPAREAGAGARAPDGEPITLTDSRGEQITLDGPATRVVGLEWNVVEHLVSLDVMPVGVSDVEGYGDWVAEVPLDGSVTDVGVRGEPSLETIAGLEPDLVIATAGLPTRAIEQLEDLVPVLVVAGSDASGNIPQMKEDVELVAEATGTEEQADRLLADFDAALVAGAEALADAGVEGEPFFMADGFIDGGQLSIRPYAEGSLLSDVNERLGLTNAWTGKGDAQYGLDQTDVEGLTSLPADTHFLYIANEAAEGDPFEEALSDNAIWTSLPFVESGDVHRLPDGIWMFGGPLSMQAYIGAVVETLA